MALAGVLAVTRVVVWPAVVGIPVPTALIPMFEPEFDDV